MAKTDPRVTKRRVTMRSVVALSDGKTGTFEAVDYVRPDHLDAYVAHARQNWQSVTVSEEPDAGPGGYEGQTFVPHALNVPDAGALYEAEEK